LSWCFAAHPGHHRKSIAAIHFSRAFSLRDPRTYSLAAPRKIGFRHDRVMTLTALTPELEGRLRQAELTYAETGRTTGVLPPGYHHLRRCAVIGHGAEVFGGAVKMLFS
jgi:hypothetical protein